MSYRRGGAKRRRDSNEPAIIEALESIGIVVVQNHAEGAPDLLCFGWFEGWMTIEVKRPGEDLTPAQQRLYARAKFPIVHSPAEALALFVNDTMGRFGKIIDQVETINGRAVR